MLLIFARRARYEIINSGLKGYRVEPDAERG